MNAQELRIGNWITDENDFPMQIVTIGTDYIYADFEGNEGDVWEFDFKNTTPKSIPLTEEILLKCGFEKIDDGYIRPLSLYSCFALFNGEDCFIPHIFQYQSLESDKSVVCLKGINYLHQLQNLFFYVYGLELEINL